MIYKINFIFFKIKNNSNMSNNITETNLEVSITRTHKILFVSECKKVFTTK